MTEPQPFFEAHPQPPERDLVRRAAKGDPSAFDHLFTTHKDSVYAYLWHLLDGDAEVVEEAVGSVFLSAFRGLSRFRGESAFSTWLYRIAVNEARRCHRRLLARNRFRLVMLLDSACDARSDGLDPEAQFLREDRHRGIRLAVRALPEPYRTPVILRYAAGMSSVEVGEVLGRPAGTIRYQLSRAMQMLRERLGVEWNA